MIYPVDGHMSALSWANFAPVHVFGAGYSRSFKFVTQSTEGGGGGYI